MSLPLFARDDAPKVWSVTELSRRVGSLLGSLGRVAVRGEVSRVVTAASGHVYFDLKDLDAKIACTIWRSRVATALRTELEEGMLVVAHGDLDVYAPRGTYSLIVQRVEQEGLGALLAALEERKRELQARGWFDRKRPLPAMPRRIGVATSRDGAALQDFLRTRSLRWPRYPLVLAHTPVQGAGAAAEIARAIARLDDTGVDAIALIRGGGSLEDLWAFNELPVAEALWNARVPVITGVGHEVDVTLADLVADWRAHTPTDAAQTLIPDRAALLERLENASNRLLQVIDEALSERERRVTDAAQARVLADPLSLVERRAESLGHLARGMQSSTQRALERASARLAAAHRRLESQSPRVQIEARQQRLLGAALRLSPALGRQLESRERRFAVACAELGALSPLAILGRGYSITRRVGAGTQRAGSGETLRDAGGVASGERIESRLARGRLLSIVERALADGERA